MNSQAPTLTVVVPCYNEDEVLSETASRLEDLISGLIAAGHVSVDSCIYFVDDGSIDRTWCLIQALQQRSRLFAGIRLSRNCGHQNALMTGLMTVPGDMIVSIDADLQDDISAIETMLQHAAAGSDVVYGVRSRRATDRVLKRFTAQAYYKLLEGLSVEIVFDHADFRLLTRRAIEALRLYEESNLFLRAIIPRLGFQNSVVKYERSKRFAGISKYTIPKMVGLAIEGVTSFSVAPLRIVTLLGLSISLVSFLLTIWAFLAAVFFGATIPGWASTVIPIYLICGVQLLCVGMIGEYVGKIYVETKRRPRSIISEIVKENKETPPPDKVVQQTTSCCP